LYEVLARHGLSRDDYELVTLGSTPNRADALRADRCDATLLSAGHDLAVEQVGFRRLARITDYVEPYLGTVLAGKAPWLDQHHDLVERFIAAWQIATTSILAAEHATAIAPVLAEVYELPIDLVPQMQEVLTNPAQGLVPDGRVSW